MSHDYTTLLVNQHGDKPKLIATIEALTGASGLGGISDMLLTLPQKFDLDTAEGTQLDAVGLWVGGVRRLTTPLNFYFSFDTVGLGWDQGVWMGPNDGTSGATFLDDDQFRLVIKSLIAADHWDGTLKSYQDLMDAVLSASGNSMYGVDNLNMTMSVVVLGPKLSATLQAIINSGIVGIKPAGVSIAGYTFPVKNNLRYSEQLNNGAGWIGISTGVTATENATANVLGEVTAEKLVAAVNGGASSTHDITQVTENSQPSRTLTLAFDVKAAELSAIRIRISDAANTAHFVYANFDIVAETFVAVVGGNGVFESATITPLDPTLSAGWYRCAITGVANPQATGRQARANAYLLQNIATSALYVGDGTSGLYLTRGQMEYGPQSEYEVRTT